MVRPSQAMARDGACTCCGTKSALARVSGGQSPPGKFLNFPLSEVLSTAISGVCIRTCIWLLSASVTCY